MTQLIVVAVYLVCLLLLGVFASRLFRGTSQDYMLASHSIGPFLLLMSLFGTTMTGFALVGSTGEAFSRGIGVYGLLASSSGLVHSFCFFVFGVKLWQIGRRYNYTTQIQFFRERLESSGIGLLLFPVLVVLVVVYLLIGVLSAGAMLEGVTRGTFPNLSPSGGLPSWLGSLAICCVVLAYVFFGGMRGTAWANAMQTMLFMLLGVVTFFVITDQLGGLRAASAAVLNHHPEKFVTTNISRTEFFSYLFIPLSVGMFPHVFQHWLTARSAASFKLPIVAHPVFILIVWLPCIMIGVWATSAQLDGKFLFGEETNPNTVLSIMVGRMSSPLLSGFLTAGVLAAIMSSLDSQFLCLGTMFTEDMVVHYSGPERFSDQQTVWLARGFIVGVVAATYLISLLNPRAVFPLGVWCFSGFTALTPLLAGALYWPRLTRAGAYASILSALACWGWLFRESGFAANPKYLFHVPFPGGAFDVHPVVVMTFCAALAMIVVSLFTRPPGGATIAKFFPRSWTAA